MHTISLNKRKAAKDDREDSDDKNNVLGQVVRQTTDDGQSICLEDIDEDGKDKVDNEVTGDLKLDKDFITSVLHGDEWLVSRQRAWVRTR